MVVVRDQNRLLIVHIHFVMKRIITICLCLSIVSISFAKSWDIAEIYEAVDIPHNSKALDSYGKFVSGGATIEKLLVPAKINTGKYEVTIIEIDKGFFKIKGTDFYIEMKGSN